MRAALPQSEGRLRLTGAPTPAPQRPSAVLVHVFAADTPLVNQGIAFAGRRGWVPLVAHLVAAPLTVAAFPVIHQQPASIGSIMSTRSNVNTALRPATIAVAGLPAVASHRLASKRVQCRMQPVRPTSDCAIT